MEYLEKHNGYVAGVRFVNGNEGKEVSCKFCSKVCNVSQFIRHVSHTKLCLETYDPEFIKGVREELRKLSKRKWQAANWDDIKAKQDAKQNQRPKYYITNSVKLTIHGRAFASVFHDIFTPHEKRARALVDEFTSKKRESYLTKDEMGEVMDKTFTGTFTSLHDMYDVARKLKDESEKYVSIENPIEKSEEEILQAFFDKLEEQFKIYLTMKSGDHLYWLKRNFEEDVFKGFHDFSLNRAFHDFYEEDTIKDAFKDAEDIAMDEVFQVLVNIESYFDEEKDLEEQMEASFKSILEKEYSLRLRELGFHEKMNNLMRTILQKKFEYFPVKYDQPSTE